MTHSVNPCNIFNIQKVFSAKHTADQIGLAARHCKRHETWKIMY